MKRRRWVFIAASLFVLFYFISQPEAMGGLMKLLRNAINRITATVSRYYTPSVQPSTWKEIDEHRAQTRPSKDEGTSPWIYTAGTEPQNVEPSATERTARETLDLDQLFNLIESLPVEDWGIDQNEDQSLPEEESENNEEGDFYEEWSRMKELWSELMGEDFPYPDVPTLSELYYEEEQWITDERELIGEELLIEGEIESELKRIILDMFGDDLPEKELDALLNLSRPAD
jgi:hypothetical protein